MRSESEVVLAGGEWGGVTGPRGERAEGTRRGRRSFRAQLSSAMLLVLLIALLPSIVAVNHLDHLEKARPDGSAVAGSADPPPNGGVLPRSGRATRDTITFTLLAAVAAGLVVMYTPIALLKALSRVTSILRQAETGNLNVAVASSRVREVSALAVTVNRTLGRLRHFDELKSRRIREEQRLVEALFAANERALALVSPRVKILRRNQPFRELVERGGGDCTGRALRDVLGDAAHDAVRRVQRERNVEAVDWSPDGPPACRLTISAVNDEVDAPPRVLVTCDRSPEADPP